MSQGNEQSTAVREIPYLVMVHHPEPAMVGLRLAVEDGEELLLGRGENCFGEGVMMDDRLSRRHVVITRQDRTLTLADQASRNGSMVNGRRVGIIQLKQGDIVGIGRVLLLVAWQPEGHVPPRHPRLIGDSAAMASLIQSITDAADDDDPVLFRGEIGVGRRTAAQELHRLTRKGTACGVFDCAGGHEPPWDRMVAKIGGGSLVLANIEHAGPKLQAKVLESLQGPRSFRLLATTAGGLRGAAQRELFLPELAEALTARTVRIPPLRHRPEDILPQAWHFAKEALHTDCHLSRRLALMVHLIRWPGNATELRESMVRLIAEQPGETLLRAPTWLASKLD